MLDQPVRSGPEGVHRQRHLDAVLDAPAKPGLVREVDAVELSGDTRRRQLPVVDRQGVGRIEIGARPGRNLPLDVVGMEIDQARQQVTAAQVGNVRRGRIRPLGDLDDTLAFDGDSSGGDDAVRRHDLGIGQQVAILGHASSAQSDGDVDRV